MSGKVRLKFDIPQSDKEEFRKDWKNRYPLLARCCTLEQEDSILKVSESEKTNSFQEISDFCYKNLHLNLTPINRPVWFAIREDKSSVILPRPGFYFVGMFILGNIVRYEPEIMLEAIKPGSELGWFLGEFFKAAERFLPQLMLAWLHNEMIFF